MGQWFSIILLLGFTEHSEDKLRAKEAESCLIRVFGGDKKKFWGQFKDVSNLHDLVTHMFHCIAANPHVYYDGMFFKTNISAKVVTKAFQCLSIRFSGRSKYTTSDILLRAGGVRVLMYLYRRIEIAFSSCSNEIAGAWLRAFAHCIKLLGSHRYVFESTLSLSLSHSVSSPLKKSSLFYFFSLILTFFSSPQIRHCNSTICANRDTSNH